MICFYQDLLDKSFELIKSIDTYKEASKDLYQINCALQNLQIPQSYDYLCYVQQLDFFMRQKYPTIQSLLDIAAQMEQNLPSTPMQQTRPAHSWQELLIDTMEQDYVGIIVGIGIKEGVKHEIKDFIKEVTREEKQHPQISYLQF